MATKIATWNINSVRARPALLQRLLDKEAIDILCLQETKCQDRDFPAAFFRDLGFRTQIIAGQPMHHGVAILSRLPLAPAGREDWQGNGEARHVAARLPSGVVLHNVYVPAGGDIPDRTQNPKFGQKLDFLERMTDWSGKLGDPAILVGDFNIAPYPEDVWDDRALRDVVSHTAIEIAALAKLRKSHGWIDLGRHFVPRPEKLYTWWSYRARDWEKSNRGRRLDHMWVSPDLLGAVSSVTVVAEARGWERPSDHAPIIAGFEL